MYSRPPTSTNSTGNLTPPRTPQTTYSHITNLRSLLDFRTPPPPLLPPGVGALYTPSASFQTLLANISAAQRAPPVMPSKPSPPGGGVPSSADYLTAVGPPPPSNLPTPASPPVSPTSVPVVPSSAAVPGVSVPAPGSTTPPQDRRSSSIAALRLKAREHELRLEMLRQNGHHSDILS